MNTYEYILDINLIQKYSLCQNTNVVNLSGTYSLRTAFDNRARNARNLKPSIRRTKLKTSSEKWSCWNRKNEAASNQSIMKINIVLEDHETCTPPTPGKECRVGYARKNLNGSRNSLVIASVRSSIY